MKSDVGNSYLKDYPEDDIVKAIPYLLAGLEGRTDGHELVSVAVQQAGVSSFRVVLRAIQREPAGHQLRVVGFTSGLSAAGVIVCVEEGYKGDLIKWKPDKFAKGIMSDNGSKAKKLRISS